MLSVSSFQIAHRGEDVITSACESLSGVTAEPCTASSDEHTFRHVDPSRDYPELRGRNQEGQHYFQQSRECQTLRVRSPDSPQQILNPLGTKMGTIKF